MSLEKKIITSFLISALIIAILAVSSYLSFIEIKKEIRYLELSDTVRSKSLQLRRHEKNFLLYGDLKEIEQVHVYLKDLKVILREGRAVYNTDKLSGLGKRIEEYGARFNRIEALFWEFQNEFSGLKPLHKGHAAFFPLIESTFLERPLVNAELLKKIFSLRPESPAIKNLHALSDEITALRKDGEEILVLSKDLDKAAREKVDRTISLSQIAALVLFPLFLTVGIIALFVISHGVARRLNILTSAIEKTGKGDFSALEIPEEDDEVGVLVKTFNKMETDLSARDMELNKKNEELLQSRKLASIGTLASGVAHELNNPLNNIYLAAQILSREMIGHETCPPVVRETVNDIFSQTLRVKRIVGDLLEFAREKPPELKNVDVVGVINDVLGQMASSGELEGISHGLKTGEKIELPADRHLMEQVFINLFGNASDAMGGSGALDVEVNARGDYAYIKVSDTGKGIAQKDIPRIFDPFFTTKEKGTGLGLAIVYSIIEKHKGKIEVKSEEGKGTSFIIALPLEKGKA